MLLQVLHSIYFYDEMSNYFLMIKVHICCLKQEGLLACKKFLLTNLDVWH